jgi:hypothetical protein
MPGSGEIEPIDDGCFAFADDGTSAIIVPAYAGLPFILDANPERHIEHLIDLIAIETDNPGRVWRRRGEAVILGSAFLDLAAEYGAPLPVYRDPLSWLKSGGHGIVILDWGWAPDLLLGLELISEDLNLGNRLEAALRPDIWVKEVAA